MENVEFNDERINYRLGYAIKFGLIIVSVISLLYFILKICYVSSIGFTGVEAPFGFEVIIFLLSLGIVVYEKIKIKSEVKDELYLANVSSYYKRKLKFLFIFILAIYSIYMPIILIGGYNYFNGITLLNFSLFIMLMFSFIYLKFQDSYLNYKIIEEDNKTFYKKVFINILKLLKIVGIMFLVSIVIGLLFLIIITDRIRINLLLSIIVVYVLSFLTNAVVYLLLSVFEKANYNNDIKEDNKKFNLSIPTIIICIIALVLSYINNLFTTIMLFDNSIMEIFKLSGETNTNALVRISKIKNYFSQYNYLAYITAITYLFFDLKKLISNQRVNKLFNILFIVNLLYLFVKGFTIYCNIDATWFKTRYINDIEDYNFLTTTNMIQITISKFLILFNYVMLLVMLKDNKKLRIITFILALVYLIYTVFYYVSFYQLAIRNVMCINGIIYYTLFTVIAIILIAKYSKNKILIEE